MKETEHRLFEREKPLEKDFIISLEQKSLKIAATPQRMDWCVFNICTHGYAIVEINMMRFRFEKESILTFFPMQLVSQVEESSDFRFVYFAFSPAILNEILCRFPTEFGLFLKDNPCCKVPKARFENNLDFFAILKNKFDNTDNICRNEIIINMLRIVFLEVYNNTFKYLSENPVKFTRKSEIIKRFFNLIMQRYKESREVLFYANELGITPKYLSMITKELDGRGAKEYIDDYVITEIKLLLKSTSKTIQEVANEINFTDQSFICKYFKARTGMSPSDYRKM